MQHHAPGDNHVPLIPVKHGRGAWLYDHEGRRYLDAISSWWVNLFGHANPRINAALKDRDQGHSLMVLHLGARMPYTAQAACYPITL